MAPNYGKKGRRRLDELQKALGRDVGDVNGREATTRRDIIEKQGGPLSIDPDIVAPSDQDMWEPDNKNYEQRNDTDQYQDYYEEEDELVEVDCSTKFPDIFIHKELELADMYYQGPEKSSRITEYKFVSVNPCTDDSVESDIEGYLYVRWESNGKVSRYGPLSAHEFKLFRDAKSLGAQCIGPGQNSDELVIRLMDHGYEPSADWPTD